VKRNTIETKDDHLGFFPIRPFLPYPVIYERYRYKVKGFPVIPINCRMFRCEKKFRKRWPFWDFWL